MEWSPLQQKALDEVADWFRRGDQQVFTLHGYAGTGKTTLARHFAEGLGTVLFGAFTGKAALVMRRSGCAEATTIHRLIYRPKMQSRMAILELEEEIARVVQELVAEGHDEPNSHASVLELRRKVQEEEELLGQPYFALNPDSPVNGADLLIVDECSMISEQMGQDLCSYGTPVLALGDPAQLPPVFGRSFFGKPDFKLTEIHRQARDNPIIDLATRVREGEPLPLGEYGQSRVLPWAPGPEMSEAVVSADQVIVGRNTTRQDFNRRIREKLGKSEKFPVKGDRLVCLRNDHQNGLLNGAIWEASEDATGNDDELYLKVRNVDTGEVLAVEAHPEPFLGQSLPRWGQSGVQAFDYGYALTCHKAQGSQFDHVLVFDQSSAFDRSMRRNWLYTAITRAAERVTVARRT